MSGHNFLFIPGPTNIPRRVMNLLRGLRESLNMQFEEGLDNVFARHTRFATATRKAVEAWGLTTIAKEVAKHAYRRYNLALSITIEKVMGKGFRIGHMSDMNELMLMVPLSGAEMAMKDLGYPVELGSGVAAVQEYLCSTAKDRI